MSSSPLFPLHSGLVCVCGGPVKWYKVQSEGEVLNVEHGKFSLLSSLAWKLLKCILGV